GDVAPVGRGGMDVVGRIERRPRSAPRIGQRGAGRLGAGERSARVGEHGHAGHADERQPGIDDAAGLVEQHAGAGADEGEVAVPAWARLPPIVPRLRMAAWAISGTTSPRSGHALLTVASRPSAAWVTPAPTVTMPSADVVCCRSATRPTSTSSDGRARRIAII